LSYKIYHSTCIYIPPPKTLKQDHPRTIPAKFCLIFHTDFYRDD